MAAGVVRFVGAIAPDFSCADGCGAHGAFFGVCEGVWVCAWGEEMLDLVLRMRIWSRLSTLGWSRG